RRATDGGGDVAETVTIQGQPYLKRNPLGVLGLTIITFGIYGLYWYYKVNEEILRYTGDQTISPSRSLLAVIPGFLLIVPPFIAYYNTSNHVVQMEQQRGIQSQISPALVVILALLIWIGRDAPVRGRVTRSGARPSPRPARPRRGRLGLGPEAPFPASIGTHDRSRDPMYSDPGRIT